jgi:hypothetical protein
MKKIAFLFVLFHRHLIKGLIYCEYQFDACSGGAQIVFSELDGVGQAVCLGAAFDETLAVAQNGETGVDVELHPPTVIPSPQPAIGEGGTPDVAFVVELSFKKKRNFQISYVVVAVKQIRSDKMSGETVAKPVTELCLADDVAQACFVVVVDVPLGPGVGTVPRKVPIVESRGYLNLGSSPESQLEGEVRGEGGSGVEQVCFDDIATVYSGGVACHTAKIERYRTSSGVDGSQDDRLR